MTLFTNRLGPASLTNSLGTVGGAADDTIAAVPDVSSTAAASVDASVSGSVNASLAVIRNNLRDLTTKVNALVSAFRDQ